MPQSKVMDATSNTQRAWLKRKENRSGGKEGGMKILKY
jgi:hypothetical protein